MARIVILTEGHSNPSDAKTACGVVRYRGEEVAGLLDSTQVGKTAEEVLGIGGDIPFISSLDQVEADTLLIGIAPAGGGLPEPWRPVLREAIGRHMTVISGLHTFLGEDPELGPLAKEHRTKIFDIRKTPDDLTVSKNIAKDMSSYRVHTVGNDCNVGKMHTAIELSEGLKRAGYTSQFVPTGQTGIMIYGWGIAVDRVISDFVSGATERLLLEHRDSEFLIVEGQGSLIHPFYSAVTLGLLHGCAPQAMIMCYEAARTLLRHVTMEFPHLDEMISCYESMANIICPSRVIALSINTSTLSDGAAEREIKSVEDQLGLPATDPVRIGPEKLVNAVMKAAQK